VVYLNARPEWRERSNVNGVELIRDPEKAKVMVDPMRREVVRLLAQRAMTENELAEALGLSDPSVGHHLKILGRHGLIRLARKEVEEHGIVQKFYETSALAYVIDPQAMPLEVERYFMPVSLERARGPIAALSIVTGEAKQVSTEELEQFAKIFTSAIVQAASRHSKRWKGDREELIIKIYRDALTHLVGKPGVLPERVRQLLLGAVQ
jgi:DNA-binding transcriptional ArsR family regulator